VTITAPGTPVPWEVGGPDTKTGRYGGNCNGNRIQNSVS
jgi:hypothetical protein